MGARSKQQPKQSKTYLLAARGLHFCLFGIVEKTHKQLIGLSSKLIGLSSKLISLSLKLIGLSSKLMRFYF